MAPGSSLGTSSNKLDSDFRLRGPILTKKLCKWRRNVCVKRFSRRPLLSTYVGISKYSYGQKSFVYAFVV